MVILLSAFVDISFAKIYLVAERNYHRERRRLTLNQSILKILIKNLKIYLRCGRVVKVQSCNPLSLTVLSLGPQ